jgi:hypothetical protein
MFSLDLILTFLRVVFFYISILMLGRRINRVVGFITSDNLLGTILFIGALDFLMGIFVSTFLVNVCGLIIRSLDTCIGLVFGGLGANAVIMIVKSKKRYRVRISPQEGLFMSCVR